MPMHLVLHFTFPLQAWLALQRPGLSLYGTHVPGDYIILRSHESAHMACSKPLQLHQCAYPGITDFNSISPPVSLPLASFTSAGMFPHMHGLRSWQNCRQSLSLRLCTLIGEMPVADNPIPRGA